MNGERLKKWFEPPERTLSATQWAIRVRVVLRALFEADDEGCQRKVTVHAARNWNGGGGTETVQKILRDLHEEGFFQTTGAITRIPELSEILKCSVCGRSNREAKEAEHETNDRFRGEDQPCKVR